MVYDAPVKLNPICANNDYVVIIVPYGSRYPIRQIINCQYFSNMHFEGKPSIFFQYTVVECMYY